MGAKVRRWGFVAIVGFFVAAAFVSATGPAQAAVTTTGYVKMSDGVDLRYSLVRPSDAGQFPVLMTYNPYDAGYAVDWAPLLADGFALLGVNMRGTGCSGGAFEVLDPREGTDGAAMVEWASRQPWSTGHVGMFGQSYSGISQLLVAAHRPHGLDAIAPGHVVSDAYRDVAYPGGIFNSGFAALFSTAAQPKRSYSGAPPEIAGGDSECATNITQHASQPSMLAQAAASPFIDSPATPWTEISPDAGLANIDVPVLSVRSWQDDEAGDRNSYLLEGVNADLLWSVQTNGSHNHPYWDLTATQQLLERFFLRFVKGDDNGWERTPRHQIFHEVGADRPAWTTTYASWPPATIPWSLSLHEGGRLDDVAPSLLERPDLYTYPMPSPSVPTIDLVSQDFTNKSPGWQVPPTPAGSVTYTTPALTRDAELLGSSSIDLWLTSTAIDTDLQATLSEVRPARQEVYLQRGWLRASHRKEDPSRSTVLRPLHTDLRADYERLNPGEPTQLRIELFPLDHVFRAGSAIRVTVDAPTGGVGDWTLDFLHTPAVNSILHDVAHPSRVMFPLVAGTAQTPYPACGGVDSEPCRTSIAPLASGSLTPPSVWGTLR